MVSTSDRNVHSGIKYGRTLHKYHVKEVPAHSGYRNFSNNPPGPGCSKVG